MSARFTSDGQDVAPEVVAAVLAGRVRVQLAQQRAVEKT